MNKPSTFIKNHISKDFSLHQGIYVSKNTKQLSYPQDANELLRKREDNSFWFLHRNQVIRAIAAKYLPQNSILLDVGGGNGFVSQGLLNIGLCPIVVEPGMAGALNAKQRGLDAVVCGTLEEAFLTPECADNVGLFDVLEHVEDDSRLLNAIYQTIKPGGFFILTVPAFLFLWSKEDPAAGHFRRYTLKPLEKKLKAAGFSVVYSSYFFAALMPVLFFFRAIPSWFGFYKVDKSYNHHKPNKGVFQLVLERLLNLELSSLRKERKLMFGSSCLFLVRKDP